MTEIKSFLKTSHLYPALVLEKYFSEGKRTLLIKITKYLLFSIPLIIVLSIIFANHSLFNPGEITDYLIRRLIGFMLIIMGIYVLMHMFEAYFTSIYYFEYVGKNNYTSKDKYTFSAGRILRQVERNNILIGFLKSQLGRKILRRLGIDNNEIDLLRLKQTEIINPPTFNTGNIPLIKVSDIANFIYNNHPDFKNLLINHGVGQKNLAATVNWLIYNIEEREYNRQWWSKEKLARIPGVATDWSFGHTYLLNKYSRNLLDDEEVNSEAITYAGRERELEQIQSVLDRSAGANAMLVGLPGQEKMEVVWNLCRKIKNKSASAKLIGKRPVLFLTSDFTSSIESKGDFEKKITTIFNEVLKGGNVILVIDNFPKLILQAKQFELKLYETLEPYLASSQTQIIALSDTEYFHTLIEPDQALMSRFEIVMTKPLLLDEIVKIIAREVWVVEKKYEIFYTYPAVLEIAKSAENYFPDGVSSDKAEDLLNEISPWVIRNNIEVVGKNEVLDYIGEKTDIPLSKISTDEKEKLLDLENLLMKRVIAQREAVFAVASALRRNRAGIRSENRPIGSFLFLGPTGVGKTETAKALADVFFGQPGQGDEKLLMRLDMSEYQNAESLSRLIGSREANTQGILANMLREHPYGVLLLDEFEKTNKDVLNLFLQIIDEGYFSDVSGKKVMARNIMFIATSNAGAEKIFEIVGAGKDLKDYESEIISYIVSQGIFKPELLNRFDATILFHPLAKDNLSEVAKLMLMKVSKRLEEKGVKFSINKELIDFIVQAGYNPTFGARPMNRLIQDTVEQHIADLIIRGDLNAGQTISFKVLAKTGDKDSLKPIVV